MTLNCMKNIYSLSIQKDKLSKPLTPKKFRAQATIVIGGLGMKRLSIHAPLFCNAFPPIRYEKDLWSRVTNNDSTAHFPDPSTCSMLVNSAATALYLNAVTSHHIGLLISVGIGSMSI